MIEVLIGSTASGKSDLAMQVARKTGAHILSCDSLLVYKDLNIGTAKPTVAEMKEIPHYGINLVTADTPYTAGDYVRYARPIIDDLVAKKIPLLIVGGTGFYLKALLFGVWDAPATHPEIRTKIEKSVEEFPDEQKNKTLHDRLAVLDPAYAAKIKPNDVYRVIRALEIIEVSGKPVSEVQSTAKLLNPLPFPYRIFGIERNKEELELRIRKRMSQMFEHGLIGETKELIRKYAPKIPRSMHCVGYWEVLEHLEGRMTLEECRERIVISTRQLAKKQMTFFKGMGAEIQWHSLPDEEDSLRRQFFSIP